MDEQSEISFGLPNLLLKPSSGVAEVCQRQVPGGAGDDTVGAILFLKFRIVD